MAKPTKRQQRWIALRRAAAVTGVVTLDSADRHGIPRRSLRRTAAEQAWTKLQPGVWLLPGVELTHRHRCLAVRHVAGAGTVIGARSAAWLHGLRREKPHRVDVVVSRDERRPRLDGVRARHSRTLLRRDVVELADGLLVTAPARTVGDLSRVLAAEPLLYAAIAARQEGQLTEDELRQVCARMRPAEGTAALAWVADEMAALDSGFEWTVRQGLARTDLPAPHPSPYELPCPDGRAIHLDIAWPAWRVGLEVMGLSAHGVATQRTDQVRHNQATAGDWTILYVGWQRWRDERAQVLAEVRSVLAARGAPV